MASRRTRFAASLSVAALALSLTGGAVFAGEITGNGKSLKQDDGSLHGRSLCAFSGQNDEFHELGPEYPRVQSWGQIPKAVRDSFPDFLHPGMACNPNIGLEE